MAEVLVREVVCRFGTPQSFHLDQGCPFESQLVKELANLLGVDKTSTIPYHPQSDWQVERFNCTLASMLSTTVGEDLQLPYLTAAY